MFKYGATNPNQKIIKMIGSLVPDVGEIMDMLNSGAIRTASETIGIVAKSESEIFRHLLGKSFTKYKDAHIKLEKLNQLLDTIDTLPKSDGTMSYSKFQNSIKNLDDVQISNNFVNLESLLVDEIKNVETLKDELSIPIDRVIDNIKHGICPICFGKISDCKNEDDSSESDDEDKEDAIIMKCCNVIICSQCLFTSTRMSETKHDIRGHCPNCRADISYADTVYLSKDLNIEQLLDESFKLEDANISSPDSLSYDKLDILTGILLQDGRYKGEPCVFSSKSLLTGYGKLPSPSGKTKSVIYTKYDESLDKISAHLDDLGIPYDMLKGTAKQLSKIVDRFQKDNDILLVNGEEYCAGLNLQFADNLIFMHRFTVGGTSIDSNIEEQIIGRLQRLGRKTQLNIHYISYSNELQ